MRDELEPMAPDKAREIYLDERKEDAAYDTLETIQKAIDLFVDWTGAADIDNMNEIRGRQLTQFKKWVKNTSDNNLVSLNGILANIRRFLVFCARNEAVWSDVPDKVPNPNVPDDADVCYDKPSDEVVKGCLNYLRASEPRSRRRVEFALVKEIGCRVGAIRALDIEDLNLDGPEPSIDFRHRPEDDFEEVKGTPLKNGIDGERNRNISERLAEIIKAYLNSPDRHDVEDKFGRKPLLTSKDGRVKVGTIRRDLYKITRPCKHADKCPHDRTIDDCPAEKNANASECPSSKSPHPLRRWSIEHQIDSGVPKEVLCDRADVSVPVLNEHYDTRSKERKRKHRLKILEKLFDGYGDSQATIDPSSLDEALFNESGQIDPQVLLSVDTTADETANSNETASNSPTEDGDEVADDQATFDRFNLIAHPALLPLFGGLAVSSWLPDRLRRELQSMAPAAESSPYPTPKRASKGIATWFVFACLVGLNLALHGLTLTGLS